MPSCTVKDFDTWRHAARDFLKQNISPYDITWNAHHGVQPDLLFETEQSSPAFLSQSKIKVPGEFIKLAKQVACHRQKNKWSLLYEALWRIVQGERYLLQLASDPLVHQLLKMKKQVSRDRHKATAFVRFKCVKYKEEDCYLAWYQSQHKILPLIAPFFVKRFAVMNWAIFTPDGYIAWDKKSLIQSEEVVELDLQEEDVEKLWVTYYGAIFNPARVKIKAMLKEMPYFYWSTMPETKVIQKLLVDAPGRVNKMLEDQST